MFLFFDLVLLVTFWFCGGDSDYLEENVEYFKFKDFVFDLVVVVFLKISILFFIYVLFESVFLK